MAFSLSTHFLNSSINGLKLELKSTKLRRFTSYVKCSTVDPNVASPIVVRRSGNYKPSIWDFHFIQSLSSQYEGDKHSNRISSLQEEVKMMLNEAASTLDQLELIDLLQRLGLAYHFEHQIQHLLVNIFNSTPTQSHDDLYTSSLQFRLLRQHGFHISPQEMFHDFCDECGSVETHMKEDTKGLLALYEASFVIEEDECILEEARKFARANLEKLIGQTEDSYLSTLIEHALELPLHWRVMRLESRWFIDAYETKQGMDPVLLEFAKLDFNQVQAVHQSDLRYASRWWNGTGLGEKLSFSRDRIVENFLWTVGVNPETQFGYSRSMATKVNVFITAIDDIYDVYGTLEELELFTDAVERWDVKAIEELPDYMKICFLSLHNSINEMAYDVLKEQGFQVIPYLKKAWTDLCKSYLVEAKWYHSGYKPTFEEYIENAWVSISAPVILTHAYFLSKDKITTDALKCLKEYPEIIRLSAMILRLADDLGTSSDELKRGDVPKSIQCYMNQTGVSEKEAREYIHYLIGETWKKMNKEMFADSPFSKTFIARAVDLARMAQCMYQYGDGHGTQEFETKDRVLSLLVHPTKLP